MTKFYTNTITILNIYKKPSLKSEITSQMIYGDNFSILKKTTRWIKIKTKEDMIISAYKLLESGAKNVLVKGGHLDSKLVQDLSLIHI